MRLKKICKMLVMLGFVTNLASAQNDPKANAGGKTKEWAITLQHNLQLNYLEFSPGAMLKLDEKKEVGGGLNTIYYARYSNHNKKVGAGINLYARYYLLKNIYAEANYMWANMPYLVDRDQTYNRIWKADVLAGVGYKQTIDKKWACQLTAYYNIFHKNYSIYDSRILFRVGATYLLK
jgi:hypothetical protein